MNHVYFRNKSATSKIVLSDLQISDMTHMTGILQTRKIGGGLFRSYRNYYWSHQIEPHLENLVNDGLAVSRKVVNGDNENIVYHLTDLGYMELSAHLKRNIRKDD